MTHTFIVGKVRHGEKWHAYEENGDMLSLCGRTPLTETYTHKDLTRVTCEPCMRIFKILDRAIVHDRKDYLGLSDAPKTLPAKRTGTRK